MSPVVKRIIGESSLNEVKPVVVKTRPVEYHVCPHCNQEIFEKHTYMEGDFMAGTAIQHHSDCGGAIEFPPTDWSKVSPEWRAVLEPRLKRL